MAFPGSVIYLLHDPCDILIAQSTDIFSLCDVLADQAIGVSVEAPLPTLIAVGKEAWGHQLAGDLFMVCKFSAIVVVLVLNSPTNGGITQAFFIGTAFG